MATSQAIGQGVALVSSVILARLIAPAEFGSAAIALIVYALSLAVAQQGIGSSLVQRASITRRHVEAAVGLSLALGAALALITAIGVSALSGVLGARTVEFLQLMSPAFLLAAPGAISQGLLERKLAFRRLATGDIVAAIAGALVSVVLAIAGLKGSAVVIGSLVNLGVDSAVLFRYAPLPRPRWHVRELREIRHFAIPATVGSIAYIATSNVDYVMLGARLGLQQTGLYWRAFSLGVDYQSKISSVLLRVAFPVLSRAETPEAVRRVRGRIVRVHAVVLLPLLGLLVASAPYLVPLLYGNAWKAAGPLTQWLAIGGMAQVINTGMGPLMLATGHPKALRNYNVASFFCFATVVWVSSGYGVLTVAICVAAYRVISLLACQYILGGLVGLRLRDTIANDIVPAGVSTMTLVIVCFTLGHALLGLGLPVWMTLIVSYVAGLATYLIVLRLIFASAAHDLAQLLGGFVPRRGILRWGRLPGPSPAAGSVAPDTTTDLNPP